MWKPMEDVRTWVHANFATWENEKPDWWTNGLIQRIPEHVLSKEEMAVFLSRGMKRRRSSVMQKAGLAD
jgi:hypothetical protein